MMDDTQRFVAQHYRDFFSREPDARSVQFGTNQIELSLSAQEALWDNFYTAAPARLRHCVERYNVVKRA